MTMAVPPHDSDDNGFAVPRLIRLQGHDDARGKLGIVTALPDAGFVFRRLYFLYDVTDGAERGQHAHKELAQVMIAFGGSFRVELRGRGQVFDFTLNDPRDALLIPSGYWRDLRDFSDGAVCLVAASHEYDEADYIRDYNEFLLWEQENARV